MYRKLWRSQFAKVNQSLNKLPEAIFMELYYRWIHYNFFEITSPTSKNPTPIDPFGLAYLTISPRLSRTKTATLSRLSTVCLRTRTTRPWPCRSFQRKPPRVSYPERSKPSASSTWSIPASQATGYRSSQATGKHECRKLLIWSCEHAWHGKNL